MALDGMRSRICTRFVPTVEWGSARVASDAFPHSEWLDDAHLLGYSISILPVVEKTGLVLVSNEASLLFGLLFTIYLIFYDFAYDLNDPFDGIYQVRAVLRQAICWKPNGCW